MIFLFKIGRVIDLFFIDLYRMKQYLLIILVMLGFNAYAGNVLPEGGVRVVSSEIIEGEGDNIKVYPNPATNTFFVEISNNKKSDVKEITLFSLLGTPVLVKQADSFLKDKIEINISSLKKGKYLVKVTFADGTSEVKSLIKQ